MYTVGSTANEIIEVVCPGCLGNLINSDCNSNLQCDLCKIKYNFLSERVVSFISDKEKTSSKMGFANSLFSIKSGEKIYSYWIITKHLIQKILKSEDERIGIEALIADCSILDLGCGPDLDSSATEYPHLTSKVYVGIDYSERFVLSAESNHGDLNHYFIRASADKLPFRDKTFDLTSALFTIHHVVGSPTQVVRELARVGRQKVIIFDHVKSTSRWKAAIQKTYWRTFDGGENYLTHPQWMKIFTENDLRVVSSVKSGIFFNHVIKFVLEISN